MRSCVPIERARCAGRKGGRRQQTGLGNPFALQRTAARENGWTFTNSGILSLRVPSCEKGSRAPGRRDNSTFVSLACGDSFHVLLCAVCAF